MDYSNKICPRCLGGIPNNMLPGRYIGALSRIDNKTEICSPCGEEEALVALIPLDNWPIVLYDHELTHNARARWFERLDFEKITLK